MTKIEAIELCLELWTWLKENPGKKKSDWPRFKEIALMRANCPACQYAYQIRPTTEEIACKYCPVWIGASFCVWDGYRGWTIGQMPQFADLVIKLCKERLHELNA